MIKFFIMLAVLVVSLATFAKDNFKMTGKIDGVGNDTLCIEYVIIEQKYRVAGYPYKVLISPDGIVQNAYLGETEEFYQYLDTILK